MTVLTHLEHRKATGAISGTQFDAIVALARKDRFSVFVELNTALYLVHADATARAGPHGAVAGRHGISDDRAARCRSVTDRIDRLDVPRRPLGKRRSGWEVLNCRRLLECCEPLQRGDFPGVPT